jgi:hypothetical protein
MSSWPWRRRHGGGAASAKDRAKQGSGSLRPCDRMGLDQIIADQSVSARLRTRGREKQGSGSLRPCNYIKADTIAMVDRL